MEVADKLASSAGNEEELPKAKFNVTLDDIVPPLENKHQGQVNGVEVVENGNGDVPVAAARTAVPDVEVASSEESLIEPIAAVSESVIVEDAVPYAQVEVAPTSEMLIEAVTLIEPESIFAQHTVNLAVNPGIEVSAPQQPGIAVNPGIEVSVPQPPQVAVNPDISIEPEKPSPKPPSSGNILPDRILQALENIANGKGYQNFKINIKEGSQHGDGFVGDIFKVTISDGISDNQLILVCKVPPESKVRREMMGMALFRREADVYNEVLPAFNEFQESKGIKSSRGFHGYPKCYFAYFDEAKDESGIIMEDIRVNDFVMESRFRPTKYENAKSVMIHLGKYHGISFAMRDQCPDAFAQFKKYGDNFSEAWSNEQMKKFLDFNTQRAITTLNENETKLKEKVLAFGNNMMDHTKRLNDPELSEPYSVLIHGDCHINNLSFRYESGIPKHTCFYDWQLLRYGAPAIDIAYFIYLCTDQELRDKHFDHLIQAYHNSLREQLELLGSDVNQLFPFTALLRQLKTFARVVLGIALFAIPMLCMEREDIPDLNVVSEQFANLDIDAADNPMFKIKEKADQKYKVRMSSIIRDMVKRGFF